VAHDKRSKAVRHAEQHTVAEPNPFEAGAKAFKAGKDVHKANPYVKGSRPYIRWINGYQAAELNKINNRPLEPWMQEAGQ